MANEFIARKGLIVLANGAKVTGSLGVQGDINATGYNVTASNLQLLGSASINGDITVGGNLTVGNADIDVVKFLAEVSSSIVPDDGSDALLAAFLVELQGTVQVTVIGQSD